MMLSAYVQTVVRKRSWTDLSRELSHAVLLSYIQKISLMSSATTTSFHVFRHTLFMKINIYLVLQWQDLLSLRDLLRLPVRKVLLLSATVLLVRVMTRSDSSLQSRLQLQISRLSLLGEILTGSFSLVRMRLNAADSMVFIFHSAQTAATAVTVTSGISAMKVLSLKIQLMSLTTSIYQFLDALLRKLRMNQNMLL